MQRYNDDNLVRALRDGDDAAFARLVTRHTGRVAALAHRILDDRSLAEDATQLTFVRFHRLVHRYEPRGRLRSYLARLCVSECRSLERSRRRRRAALASLAASCQGGAIRGQDSAALWESRSRALAVRRALETLPESVRQAIVLRYFEDLPYAEISDRVGAPESTIRSRVFQGLRRLRQEMDPARRPASRGRATARSSQCW